MMSTMKAVVIREAGGGKGVHRKFAYTEVNLAAILMELSRSGVSTES